MIKQWSIVDEDCPDQCKSTKIHVVFNKHFIYAMDTEISLVSKSVTRDENPFITYSP